MFDYSLSFEYNWKILFTKKVWTMNSFHCKLTLRRVSTVCSEYLLVNNWWSFQLIEARVSVYSVLIEYTCHHISGDSLFCPLHPYIVPSDIRQRTNPGLPAGGYGVGLITPTLYNLHVDKPTPLIIIIAHVGRRNWRIHPKLDKTQLHLASLL